MWRDIWEGHGSTDRSKMGAPQISLGGGSGAATAQLQKIFREFGGGPVEIPGGSGG